MDSNAREQSSDARQRQIAELIRNGAEQGFTLLLDEHGGRVAGHLRHRFPSLDDHDLQDVLADAALVLATTFDPTRGSLAAWFLFLAHQQAVGRLRSRGPEAAAVTLEDQGEPVGSAPLPLEALESQERMFEVVEVMASLSDLERAVIEADLEEGAAVPAELLAANLKTTAGSVYAARQRARRKLVDRCSWIRDRLRSEGPGDGKTTT